MKVTLLKPIARNTYFLIIADVLTLFELNMSSHFLTLFVLSCANCPTVCVTCVWAGVDSVWEQEKLEARKMPEHAAESHTSGARFVRCGFAFRLFGLWSDTQN
jgi:hypothetical protein